MGYRGWRVVAWTPYGREIFVSILSRYVSRDHEAGLVDEWMLCMNTGAGQESDDAYARELAAKHAWIRLYPLPQVETWKGKHPILDWSKPHLNNRFDIIRFYSYLTDRNTIYIRLDDDIVYVHPGALKELAWFMTQQPGVFAAFPVIINNAIISWYLQRQHKTEIPGIYGRVMEPTCLDPAGCSNPRYAEQLHYAALDRIEAGDPEHFFLEDVVILGPAERFSTNTFAMLGREIDDIKGIAGAACSPWDEEGWVTKYHPPEIGKRNMIVPGALVSHFSFHPTTEYLLETGVLERYRALADAL